MSTQMTRADKVRARRERQAQVQTRRRWQLPDLSKIPRWVWVVLALTPLAIILGLSLVELLSRTQLILLLLALVAFAIAIYLWRVGRRARRNPQALSVAKGLFIAGFTVSEVFIATLLIKTLQAWHIAFLFAELSALVFLMEALSTERKWGFLAVSTIVTILLIALAMGLAQGVI